MKALLLLGGPSGANWQELQAEIKPDILMGANGANIHPLDVWICSERMTYADQQARKGDKRNMDIMEMFQRTTPKKRYVNAAAMH